MTIEALKEELVFFEEQKATLLKTHLGQYALIKGRNLIGIHPTREQAYEEGVALFASEAFLIQEITERHPPEQVPLLAYSLRANL
jgi:hypothetical protein